MGRVAAIAIDAAEWWYVRQLLDDGALPNLAGLIRGGATAELRSRNPFLSELVWARFLTGQEPLESAEWPVCVTFDPQTYGIGANEATARAPFFALGSGTKVVALDLIHSRPARGVDGEQVVAWGSHSPQFPRSSLPVGLVDEIDQRFGTNPAFDNDFDCGWHNASYLDALGRACAIGVHRRTDVAGWLLERNPDWDLFLTCLAEFHSLGHHAWHGVDPAHPLHGRVPTTAVARRVMEAGAREIDAALGRLLALLGSDTDVVVFAMHGFQPADDVVSTVLLPELLHRHHLGSTGLLRDLDSVAWRRAGCPPVVPQQHDLVGRWISHRFADSPAQRARRLAWRVVPDRLAEAVKPLVGRERSVPIESLGHRTPPETRTIDDAALAPFRTLPDYQPAGWYRRHWPRMPWFALPGFADGHIRINLRGRERAGLVERADYARALDDAERLLRSCVDARTGAQVVAEVLRPRSGDPLDPAGPASDLVVVWEGAPDALDVPGVGVVGPYPHLRMGHHSPNGFAVLHGPSISPGDLGERPAEDLPPTILGLLGRSPRPGTVGTSLLGTRAPSRT